MRSMDRHENMGTDASEARHERRRVCPSYFHSLKSPFARACPPLAGSRGMFLLPLLLILILSACGNQETETTDIPKQPPVQTPSAQPAPPPQTPQRNYSRATVIAVDLQGKPVPGVFPIATQSANALDKPIAQGQLTSPDGTSVIDIPKGQNLFIRAWDPAFQKFANNFWEVLPSDGEVDEDMLIQMVEGATLEATLLAPDGQPVANENVGLMLFHPTQGPWWPGQGDTDDTGLINFGRVPAGQYTLKLKALASGQIELGSVMISPGESANLGVITLLEQ